MHHPYMTLTLHSTTVFAKSSLVPLLFGDMEALIAEGVELQHDKLDIEHQYLSHPQCLHSLAL